MQVAEPALQPPQPMRTGGRKRRGPRVETLYHPVSAHDGQPDTPSIEERLRRTLPRNLVMYVVGSWWVELLAMGLMVAAFSGLVAALSRYQNQPIPNWPAGLTLNAALSVFSAIFKGPMLYIASQGIGQIKWQWLTRPRPLRDLSTYDAATRGPMGAIKLLWTARWRHVTAFLGGLITIVAISVEPFTQTVISYYGCDTSMPEANATISRLNSYFNIGGPGRLLAPNLRVAMSDSLGRPNAILPNATCSATACTFSQPYHSIGFCSSCDDVTHQVITSCNLNWNALEGGCSYTLTSPFSDVALNTTAKFSLVRIPDDNSGNYSGRLWEALVAQKFADPDTLSGGTMGTEGPDSAVYLSSIIDFVSAKPIMGCRCSVYYCVRSYTATIESGVLQETLQSTSSNWSSLDGTAMIGTVEVSCLSPAVQARLLTDGYTTPETVWMSWNGTYLNGTEVQERISSSSSLAIPIECAYQAQLLDDSLDFWSAEYFTDFINGSVDATSSGGTLFEVDQNAPDTLVEIYNNGSMSLASLSSMLANVTTAASNYIRTENNASIPHNLEPYLPSDMREIFADNPVHGDPGDWNQPIRGNATTGATCVEVRWRWLSVPALLIVGTLVFLAALILQNTSVSGPEVWKSSQEALLWHGLSGPTVSECSQLDDAAAMERRANQVIVTFRQTGTGWKLVQDQ